VLDLELIKQKHWGKHRYFSAQRYLPQNSLALQKELELAHKLLANENVEGA